MNKTFVTKMPNHIGAFLKASRCFASLGINITRVSYNKAVDSHMLFIDAEGTPQQLEKATEELSNIGYAKSIGALNFYEVIDDSPITAQSVIDDLQTSPIGQRVYNMLDELPEGIKCTEGKAPAGVLGEHSGNSIIIHVDNCSSNTEVA